MHLSKLLEGVGKCILMRSLLMFLSLYHSHIVFYIRIIYITSMWWSYISEMSYCHILKKVEILCHTYLGI